MIIISIEFHKICVDLLKFSIPSVLNNYSVFPHSKAIWKMGQIGSVLMVCYLHFNASIQKATLWTHNTNHHDQKKYSIKDQFSFIKLFIIYFLFAKKVISKWVHQYLICYLKDVAEILIQQIINIKTHTQKEKCL